MSIGEWRHVRGYRLDADGKAIEYRHPSGLVAYVEAMVNEDPDGPDFEFRPSIIGPDREFAIYPQVCRSSDEALERLHHWMEDLTGEAAQRAAADGVVPCGQ